MLLGYIKVALRNLLKHRFYAAINVVGLAIGLTVFLLSLLLARYETNHDYMFENRDQIYFVGVEFTKSADIGVQSIDAVQSAFGPLLRAQEPELEALARSINREYLVTVEVDNYYQSIKFVDTDFTKIFHLDYIAGDASVIHNPTSVILSRSAAEKYFGHTDVLGAQLELDHEHSMTVGAVFEDIGKDSHFNSALIDDSQLEFIAPFSALKQIADYSMEGEWNNISFGNRTYALIPKQCDQQWLQQRVDSLYEEHLNPERKDFIQKFRARPLIEANTILFDAIGMPIIESVRLLGLMVLLIACVNYTNLATAQSFSRTREVGLRKSFGASRNQLLVQFLVESLTTAVLALLIAVAAIELIIPWYNQALDKAVQIYYLETLPLLMLVALMVGLIAGAYPAYQIAGVKPVDSLKNNNALVSGGGYFRSTMIGLQFAMSTFMLAIVMVMLFQGEKMQKSSYIYPRDEVLVLDRLDIEGTRARHESLKEQLLKVKGVKEVSYSSQVPFDQSNSTFPITPLRGDKSAEMSINQVRVDTDFLSAYNIPLLAGRGYSLNYANDKRTDEPGQVNVIINETAAARLGLGSAQQAIGKTFYNIQSSDSDQDEFKQYDYSVIGVVEDQNFLGLHNTIKPMIFLFSDDWRSHASIRLDTANLNETLSSIEKTWNDVIPDYPLQRRFLDEVFEETYQIIRAMSMTLSGFAAIALSLALIGLFGLAAFMAERRTKEIGIRKVLGAKASQVAYLLIWQFSIPVVWSLLVSIPAAYFASSIYLGFFADKIDTLIPVLLVAGVIGIATAWMIVSLHAFKVARLPPIRSLRYE
ncbi:MAG: FtsX-like permease family protein [Pseudomonadota bacterium]